ncbi:hypothetical protein EJ110_NYTH30094 [Nymphaea thermarum]|nr:hypothetical protein EJ110_NYTH30094 [Nymphaea thermarum]
MLPHESGNPLASATGIAYETILGSLFSMYGCRISLKKLGSDNAGCLKVDDESGSSVCLANDRSQNATATNKNTERHVHEKARRWGYIFQIVFQLMVTMHSINVVLLFIDTWLNRMVCLWFQADERFLWCHIAYFILWTCIYVIFQWILHACTSSG